MEQINGYAVAPRVKALRQGTQMHKIVMQFVGWELHRMEEISVFKHQAGVYSGEHPDGNN